MHAGTVQNMLPIVIEGIVQAKNLFMPLFTHCHVVPTLYYSFVSCAERKRRYFEKCG